MWLHWIIKCKHQPAALTSWVLTFLAVAFYFLAGLGICISTKTLIFPLSTSQSDFRFLWQHQEYPLVSTFPVLNCDSRRFLPPCLLSQSSWEIWRALGPRSHATSGLRCKCVLIKISKALLKLVSFKLCQFSFKYQMYLLSSVLYLLLPLQKEDLQLFENLVLKEFSVRPT